MGAKTSMMFFVGMVNFGALEILGCGKIEPSTVFILLYLTEGGFLC